MKFKIGYPFPDLNLIKTFQKVQKAEFKKCVQSKREKPKEPWSVTSEDFQTRAAYAVKVSTSVFFLLTRSNPSYKFIEMAHTGGPYYGVE